MKQRRVFLAIAAASRILEGVNAPRRTLVVQPLRLHFEYEVSMKKTLLVFVGAMLVSSFVKADDWPQFRGPDRTGVSKEKGLLKAWPKEGPKLAWTFKNAGLGFSSVAIVDGKLYTLGTRDKDEIILALDAATGKELWTAKIAPSFTFDGNIWGDGPRSTPTVDGNFLYALGGQGELVCVDIAKQGKEIWRKNLDKDLDGKGMVTNYWWGHSESPLIDGKLLICTPGGPKGTLAALDKTNGNVVWRSKELTNAAPYSSAIAADIQGARQYIQLSYVNKAGKESGVVTGFDAKNGNVLWSETIFKATSYAIAPMPIVFGNKVYVTTGYGGGCHVFDIDNQQKATDLYSKKAQKKVKNTLGGVVLIDGHIYGHSEAQMWVCQDVNTGDLVWDERNALVCKSGATTAADGMLYFYTDDGEVALVEASPKGFNLVSTFKIPERSKMPDERPTCKDAKTWAYPVVANGYLFVRDLDLIFAYKVAK